MSDRGAWRLEVFAVEQDGSVWSGPWPAQGDPEGYAFRIGAERGWPPGVYALRLIDGGECRAWREVGFGFRQSIRTPKR